jgi:putative transposase
MRVRPVTVLAIGELDGRRARLFFFATFAQETKETDVAHQEDSSVVASVMELLMQAGFDGFAEGFRLLLNEAMKLQRSAVLAAQPYERTDQRRGYANGFKPKTVATRMGATTLAVPQVRGDIEFYPSALEKGVRSERAIKLAVAEMYVQGVSTRRVTEVMQELCGLEVSSSQVSRAAGLLDEELAAWRNQPLGEVPYLVLDARYEKVRHAGTVISCAVLIAVGVNPAGKRQVLGVSVSLTEAETHWRNFLEGLLKRGLCGVRYVVSDDHAGLRAALAARLAGVPWQRCQFHLQQNVIQHVSKLEMRKEVAGGVRDVFNAPDRHEADRRLARLVEKYRPEHAELADWLEENVPESLTVFVLPTSHRLRMRTSNMLENLNEQVRRRTRVAVLFPNDASLLRLVAAVLMEIDEEWETGKVYLNMRVTNS